MYSSRSLALIGAVLFSATFAGSLCAEDWTTNDGKVYQNVIVVKAEPDAVTIIHHDGGALVPLTNLSPELQKRFNYDPVTAQIAAAVRIIAETESAKAMMAEMNQYQLKKQEAAQAQDSTSQTAPSETPASTDSGDTSVSSSDPLTEGVTGPTHHSTSDLVDVNERLRFDHPDPTHHTAASLLASSHNLDIDPSDPKHHTADQLLNGDPLSK